MKMTTAVKSWIIAFGAGTVVGACRPQARAQSDMSPDEFAFSAPETTVAQPTPTVTAKLIHADFEGKVSLPYDVKCGNTNLKAGQYVLSVMSVENGRVVTINGGGQNMNMEAREVASDRAAAAAHY